jgi:hypothetical protein
LAEGSSVDELKAAIRGSRSSKFLVDNRNLQTLATVLKDSNAVECYAALDKPQQPAELTGLAKARWEALQGQHGEHAKKLAEQHEDPIEWKIAMGVRK